MTIQLSSSAHEQVRVLSISGKIDAKTMGDFEAGIRGLMDQGHFAIVLDLAEVPFISSAGLGVLMAVIDEIRMREGDLVLASVHPDVYRIFDLLDFNTLFRFYDDVASAVAAFAPEGVR